MNVINYLNQNTHFLKENCMEVVEVDQYHAKVQLCVDEKIYNLHQSVHGGAIFALADTAAGSCAIGAGKMPTTLSGHINYFKPGRGKQLIAIAIPQHIGRTTGVFDVTVTNDQDLVVAKATFTMFFLDQRKEPAL